MVEVDPGSSLTTVPVPLPSCPTRSGIQRPTAASGPRVKPGMTLATSQPAFPPGLRTHYAPLEHFPVLAAIPPAGVVSAAQAPPAPERGRCPPIGGVPFTMEETGMARTPSPSDPVALEDFGNDDSSRWAQIARRYRAPLTGFFATRVRNPSDVDDLVQDVFVQLIRRAEGGPIEHVEQYLFQVAANVLRDQGRRRQVRHADEHDAYDEDLHALATEISPERVLLGEESLARVTEALSTLPERTRDVFLLRALERCKFGDIARMLGVSKSTVEKEMARAMAHLNDHLGR